MVLRVRPRATRGARTTRFNLLPESTASTSVQPATGSRGGVLLPERGDWDGSGPRAVQRHGQGDGNGCFRQRGRVSSRGQRGYGSLLDLSVRRLPDSTVRGA